jgi:hypothetical protein
MSDAKLLPCPFCGENPHGIFGPDEEDGLWRVECFGNDYSCGDWIIEADSYEDVVAAWNFRPGKWTAEQIAKIKQRAEELWRRHGSLKLSDTPLSQSIIDKLAAKGFTEVNEFCCRGDSSLVKEILTAEEWEEFQRVGRELWDTPLLDGEQV